MELRSHLQYHRLLFGALFFAGICLLFLHKELFVYFIGPAHMADAPFYPFLDMHGRLAAFEAHRQGIDVLHYPNPLDPMHRASVKPTWPLALSFLGLGPQHLVVAGASAVVAFICVTLTYLKPVNLKQVALYCILCFSPPVILGVERANDDLVYFCLLALVPLCLKRSSLLGYWLAWLVIFLLAPAKYYPGAVFLVLLAEVKDWRQLGLLLGAGACFVAVYARFNIDEILYLKNAVPQPDLLFVHGAFLPLSLLGLPLAWGKMLCVAMLLFSVAILFVRRWPDMPETDISLRRSFLLGASVYVFCFFLNSNYDYRFVYVLPMLPLIIESSKSAFWRRPACAMIVLLVVVFWWDMIALRVFQSLDIPLTFNQIAVLTAMKSCLLWLFTVGVMAYAATLLRPNIRSICQQLSDELMSTAQKESE